MKKYISALLIYAVVTIAVTLPMSVPAQTAELLTNASVIKMLKDGFSAEIVIAKIRTSATQFDTTTEALKGLMQAGVPDPVVLAMVERTSPPADRTAAAPSAEVKVPDGQEIEIELTADISSQDVKKGDLVYFFVTQDVIVDGVTVIEKGATARAVVTTAKQATHWGQAGKIEWAMKDVMALDRSRIPVRFTKRAVGESKGGSVAISAVGLGVLFPPLALLAGLRKGKPAIIGAGNRYQVFVDGTAVLKGRAM